MKKLFILLSCFFIILGSSNTTATSFQEKPAPKPEMKIYTGEELRTIAFPVGGLGTGNITIGGRGEIREMETIRGYWMA